MDSLFMEDIFSLDIEEPIIPDTARTDLYEMCHLLDEIEYLETVNDPWYLSEAVINPKDKKRGNAAKFISASKPMYSAITDANATAINTGMGFITKICQLAVKVWTFIVKIITWIPNAIAKTLNFIIHLPGDVFHKIKGNLELYIPIEAINTMYQKNVIVMLNSLISDGKDFMKGKAWDGFVKRILSDIMAGATLEIIKPNDKEMAKRITKKTQILNNITFTKTIIDMNNDKNKEIYFGQGIDGNNKMRVRKDKLDIIGKKMNYLQALQGLFNDITKKQNDLKEIVDTINDKLLSSKASGNWDKLDANYQYIIKNAISGMTASITFTGKVLKYITADMKTYQNVLNRIQKKNIKKLGKQTNQDILESVENSEYDIFEEEYYDEASHGKLKFDFRMGWDYNTGHMIKVIYSLDNIQIDDVGDFYYSTHNVSHDEHLDYTRKNIAKKGSTDHQSHGQKVLAIVDLVTKKRLNQVKLLNPYCEGIDTHKTQQSPENLKEAQAYADKNPDKIFTLTVGQIDNNPSFKSTHWASNVIDPTTGENFRFRKISQSEILKDGRGWKVNNINARGYNVYGHDTRYMIKHNPSKKDALREIEMRWQDSINFVNDVKDHQNEYTSAQLKEIAENEQINRHNILYAKKLIEQGNDPVKVMRKLRELMYDKFPVGNENTDVNNM